MKILHLTHIGDVAMLRQTKGKSFWSNVRNGMKKKYEDCKICTENKTAKAYGHNEVSYKYIFQNLLPGQQLELIE